MGKLVGKRVGAWALFLCCAGSPVLGWAQTAESAKPPKPVPAPLDDRTKCLVRVIHATPQGQKFDERLGALRPQLTRPPFSAFSQFALLSQHELQMAHGQSQTFAVPGEHNGTLTFEGFQGGTGKPRIRLKLEILDGTAKLLSTKFLVNSGGTVLQAGMKHQNGILVLSMTCYVVE
ncbi:MAG TPA: hypothetical protein PKE31_17235 [Pseudomonadota bacterium]|nr:hypothetical protein [Pseudomonadota bacterium]